MQINPTSGVPTAGTNAIIIHPHQRIGTPTMT